MSDHTWAGVGPARKPAGNRLEYRFYFTAIFLAALPFKTLSWLLDVVLLNDSALRSSIIDRARREANQIAPRIFSA
jgi:hypothetical protein